MVKKKTKSPGKVKKLAAVSREEKRELARTLLIIKTAVSRLDPGAIADSSD